MKITIKLTRKGKQTKQNENQNRSHIPKIYKSCHGISTEWVQMIANVNHYKAGEYQKQFVYTLRNLTLTETIVD